MHTFAPPTSLELMRIPSIAASILLLSLSSAPVAAQIYQVWERPRNNVTLPITEPTSVDIYLPRKELYSVGYSSNAMMMAGPIAGSFIQGRENQRNARQDELAATLQAGMPAVDYGALLQGAFEKHIGPAILANVKRVTVHHGTPADIQKAAPGDPNEQTLALVVRYYLGPSLCDLRVSMTARLGARHIVASAPGNKRLAFSQILAYDVPAGCMIIGREEKHTRFWTDMGATAVSNHIVAGIDGVMATLAHGLATPPRFGRFPGKQIGWTEGWFSNSVGIVERRLDQRVLVRLRNGVLVSLPNDDPRVQ